MKGKPYEGKAYTLVEFQSTSHNTSMHESNIKGKHNAQFNI